jgi:hypothetical protein
LNGTEPVGIDVELALESGLSLNSNGSLSTDIASIHIPQGGSGFYTLFDGNLVAGSYALDNYAGAISVDHNYQVNFTTSGVPSRPR